MLKTLIKWLTPSLLTWLTDKAHAYLNRRQDKREEVIYIKKIKSINDLHLAMEKAKEAGDEKEIIRLHMLITANS
jgi:hypothetical protein